MEFGGLTAAKARVAESIVAVSAVSAVRAGASVPAGAAVPAVAAGMCRGVRYFANADRCSCEQARICCKCA